MSSRANSALAFGGPSTRYEAARKMGQSRALDLTPLPRYEQVELILPACNRLTVKQLLVEDVEQARQRGVTREMLARRLSHAVRQEVTKSTLDAWTSESRDRHIPSGWIAAWCAVVGSTRVLDFLCEQSPRHRKLLALAERRIEARRCLEEAERIERELAS